MKRNSILQGDALAALRTLPDESVDMCLTSPPYWRLRDYGTAPLVWDGDRECQHEWKVTNAKLHAGRGDAQKSAKYSEQAAVPDRPIQYAFCTKCGAWKGSLGLEPTPDLYITHLCNIFDQVIRVLASHGGCWVNLGDSYAGKSLCQIPSRFAVAMTNRGWFHRNTIVWHKPNARPEPCKDRFTRDFEELYFFAKSPKPYFKQQLESQTTKPFSPRLAKHNAWDNDPSLKRGKGANAVMKYNPLGRNKRCVWSINSKPFRGAHFATYPPELCQTPIDAGCPPGGLVLDPFFGAGTTGLVALEQDKDFVGIELNPDYIQMAVRRLEPFMPVIFEE